MRTSSVCSTIAVVALGTTIGLAQMPTKIATMADHVAVMKSNAQANGALNKSLGSASYGDAKTAAATLRANFTTLRTFWSEKKNAAALKIVDDGLSRLQTVEKTLAGATPDQMAAQAAAKEFGGATCATCHKLMREGDAQTGFRFRAGMNPF